MSDDITRIKSRNSRVEADKAWETSKTRRMMIATGTYLIVALYLSLLGVQNPWLQAAVPAGAYLISTFSLVFIKNLWVAKVYKP